MPEEKLGKKRKYNLLFACTSIIVSILVSLAGVELVTRAVIDDGMNFDLEMWKYARDIKRKSPIQSLGHEHTPNTSGKFMGATVNINTMGLRDREYPQEKPQDGLRILMLGDSVTFGWGVEAVDTVAKKLEEKLNAGAENAGVEVINAGVGNYNTIQEVTYFLKRGARLNPDIVILNYFINDAEPTPARRERTLMEYSYAAVYFSGRFDILRREYFGSRNWLEYYKSLYNDNAPGWVDAVAQIRTLAAYCRDNGIRLLIVNYPELHQLSPYPFAEVTVKLEKVAASEAVTFLDLLPAIGNMDPSSLWVSPDDAHPNHLATEAYANALMGKLTDVFLECFDAERKAEHSCR
jgi:lysophospholipase L1-like esterase